MQIVDKRRSMKRSDEFFSVALMASGTCTLMSSDTTLLADWESYNKYPGAEAAEPRQLI